MRSGKAVRMLGVCMDLDETKVAERRANARNERVEAALQLTTAGVWDWDVENGLTNNTDGYYRVFGVEPAFGRANHELASAARHRSRTPSRPVPRRLRRVDPAAQVLETEYRFRHTDGSWHWALDRAFVVDRAADGATRRVVGLVVDITARKMRETALSASDQRFRAIARELRCVIYEIDAETGLATGEGVERVLGYSPQRSAARVRLGARSCIPTTSRCSSNGSTATPNPLVRSSTASGTRTATT